jgi:RHS repeat-associated protein
MHTMFAPQPISRLRRSRTLRATAAIVVASQVLWSTPILAQEAARVTVSGANDAAQHVRRQVARAAVRVNRTVPRVTRANIDPMFGMNVTTDALTRSRVFTELLIPTGEPTAEQNAALARALERFATSTSTTRLGYVDEYIASDPTSPWRASLLANAATLYDGEAYYSRAAAYWHQAWELTRDSDEARVRAIADYSIGKAIDQMVKFGQLDKLEATLKELEGRSVRGPAATQVANGQQAAYILRNHHEMALFSGPEALKMYLTVRPTASVEAATAAIGKYHPGADGTSLTQLRDLAKSVGVSLTMWRSSTTEHFPVPSIVHLRSQHFSAIVESKDGKYRLRDPGLGGDFWISEDALRDESTGYVLAAAQPGDSWRAATDGEGQSVVGHCFPGLPNSADPAWSYPMCGGDKSPGAPPARTVPPTPENPDLRNPGGPPEPPCEGMPHYRFHPASASLIIEDVPVGYTPAIGPDMAMELAYNHDSYKTPSTFGYGNVGPLWTFNALAYISDNNTQITPPYSTTVVYLRGAGKEIYSPYNSTSVFSGAELVKIANDPPNYERRLLDGTVEVYALADRAASLPGRRVFLTEVNDPQGHSQSYTYDSSFRLVAITDALGQVTEFEYANGSDANLLTKITDPFGRYAQIGYDAQGRLTSITDAAAMTSTFTYGNGDFIVAMTTPYGATTFRHEPGGLSGGQRSIEAVDPAGGRERLELSVGNTQGLASSVSSSEVPTGFTASNAALETWNTWYWDKVAMARYPGDHSKAVLTALMMAPPVPYDHPHLRPVPHSVQRPGEARIWYRYPDQSGSHGLGDTGTQPTLIGRVLEGGVSQVTALTYNSKRHLTSITDPLGRQTTFTYAMNGIDLTEVRQVISGGTDLLQALSDYTSQHLPETITDAAGHDTAITYNSAGQPLTITNANSETTSFTYDATTHNLLTVTGPVSGATTTFTYDAYNRVETVEGSDGYVVTFAYDALNRLVSRTYPDDTSDTFTYARLDLVESRDRLGRSTRSFYDGYGRRTSVRDPLGRTVAFDWCSCGVLDALIDPKGQRTTWERDVLGRVTREIRADGTTDTSYTYDLAGRLKTVTDPMDQVTTYTYNLDGSLASTGFTNETIATADMSQTYDTYYPRVATMVDGNGTTTYAYVAAGTNGAGHVASIDGPLSSDTMVYTYDDLGRVASRKLNSTGTDLTYDTLGRLSQLTYPIGDFDYTYVGTTGRRSTVTFPNSQTTTYSYLDAEHDFRLQTIHHKDPSAATLSKFDYTYDTVGNILTWRQERAGATTQLYTFTHDLVDQLTSALLTDTNTTPTLLKRQAWAYDVAGNRTVDQIDDAVFSTTHDPMNRMGTRAPGGTIVFEGSLNEPGTVTIDGLPAIVDSSNNFKGTANLTAATTTVTLKAKDASGNETTKQYEVDRTGSTTSYSYDANGNLTGDGTKTYLWNALNQLVEVKEGTTTVAAFAYDGLGRRTQKTASGLSHSYVYDAEDIIEERISGSSSDTIRYYHGAGIDEPLARKTSGGAVTYYLADHLGSIIQETTSTATVSFDREYDPWGVPTQGGTVGGYAFAGRDWDNETGLSANRQRYYRPGNGRWLSEDPIGFQGGLNLSIYVAGNPTRLVDPFGLCGGDQDEQRKNPLDAKYGELARRPQQTITDVAARDIAERSVRMTEPGTYGSILVAGAIGTAAASVSPAVVVSAVFSATVYVESNGGFVRGTDAMQGTSPTLPATNWQYFMSYVKSAVDLVFQ